MNFEFGREPRSPKYARLCPLRWSEIMPRIQMLCQRGEQSIPALVPDGLGFIADQARLHVVGFPSVFLQELPNELPANLVILGSPEVERDVSASSSPGRRASRRGW
jgi:hypothetical protein